MSTDTVCDSTPTGRHDRDIPRAIRTHHVQTRTIFARKNESPHSQVHKSRHNTHGKPNTPHNTIANEIQNERDTKTRGARSRLRLWQRLTWAVTAAHVPVQHPLAKMTFHDGKYRHDGSTRSPHAPSLRRCFGIFTAAIPTS